MTGWKSFFLLFVCFTGFHFATFGQSAIKGNTYAVVVGIARYQNPDLQSLQFADKDAALFAAYLRSKAGGEVPISNIKLLVNETATIAAIYDALNWLQNQCTAQDKAYIYFSGHGDVETKNTYSLGYLLAYNSPPNNYRNNAITIEDLNKVANHLSAKSNATVVLVTDACHSGRLAGDYYKGKQLVASQLKLILDKEVRLAACAVDEKAAEGEDWGGGRGVFSYYLLKGLNGLADLNKNDTIQLEELKTYLGSAFAVDQVLIRNAHQQHPALDGNPYQTLAVVDKAAFNTAGTRSDSKSREDLKSLLSIFKPLGIQPIDYLFERLKARSLPFSAYGEVPRDSLPLHVVDDCIAYQEELNLKKETEPTYAIRDDSLYIFADIDTLMMLRDQVLKSKPIIRDFTERLIQTVHGLAQDMVNAYLAGDVAELERRQYYYARNRNYGDFLNMLRFVVQITPPDHYLLGLLKVQEAYISGLTARLEMATTQDVSALMTSAFSYQQKALKLEPYAAYIHNEIGNLYLRSKNYAQADRHFNLAKEIAPQWAIPWSNQIRLGLATKNLQKASKAIKIADSLQQGLPYIFMNAGLVMAQKGDLLAAESYFRKAIAKNDVHFLPYERLGDLYIRTGDYEKADRFLAAASYRKNKFAVNDESFQFGPELGGIPENDYFKTNDKQLADLYIAASGYERGGLISKALEEYARIVAIENEKQLEQAALKGFDVTPEGYVAHFDHFSIAFNQQQEAVATRYETPINMVGYIKIAGLFEKSGNYLMAEKAYLDQVQRNREAGFLRGKQTTPSPLQLMSDKKHNVYWRTINRQAEAATYDFYQRMLRLFPRDAEWQEKAGLFLYQRLVLAFRRIPFERYEGAYQGIKKYAYPFKNADETGWPEDQQEEQIKIAGTGEIMTIKTPKYDPLEKALESLKLAVQLSGDLKPKPQLLEAIADLNSWMGNRQAAFETFKELIQNDKPDLRLRNKIIDYCFKIGELEFAMGQLEILNRLGQATIGQKIQLSNCYALKGWTDKAIVVLNKIKPSDNRQKTEVTITLAKANWLAGRQANALGYLKSVGNTPTEVAEDTVNQDSVNKEIANRYYSIARLNVLLKQNDKALAALSRSLELGFAYGYVLNSDVAWNSLRATPRWKLLSQRYAEQLNTIDYVPPTETPSSLYYQTPE